MTLLFDQNISYQIIKKIAKHFPDALQAGRIGMSQTTDSMLWQFAQVNGYVIVTYDSYFIDRTLLVGEDIPKVIRLITQNKSTENVAELILSKKRIIKNFLKSEELSCLEIMDKLALR